MAAEASEELVSVIIEAVGLDIATDGNLFRAALRNNKNDPDKVIGEFFEDEPKFRKKYTWDEAAFKSDREGDLNKSFDLPFNVDAHDNGVIDGVTPPPDSYWAGSSAPTRPPSRTNNRSPLSRAVEWPALNASGAPNTSAQEDEDIARAIKESAAESGVLNQETGVMDINNQQPYFGPANRDAYDANQWAMVTTETGTQVNRELELAPSARRRDQVAPAFLIQDPNAIYDGKPQNYLGAILTIFHEIPVARNVLLRTGEPASSYGHNPAWWKGDPIYTPQALAAIQQGQDAWSAGVKPDFHQEVHRLVAFLDTTDRSYGSTETLGGILSGRINSLERKFFDTLSEENDPETVQPLMTDALSILTKTFEVVDRVEKFSFLDFELNDDQWAKAETFYDIWDCLAWDETMAWQELTDTTKMTVFGEMGEVLTLLLNGQCQKSIDIPDVWYPERYLQARMKEAKTIQEHLAWVLRRLYEAMAREHQLNNWEDPETAKVHKRRDMLVKAIEKYDGYSKYLKGLADFQPSELFTEEERNYSAFVDLPPVLSEDDENNRLKTDKVLACCKQRLGQLDAKLQRLESERDQLRQYQRHLGKILTDPEKTGSVEPFVGKKYLLRGVATARNVIYVCRRAELQLIELDDSSREPSDQWWRLAYVVGDQQPVKAEKVEIELVKRQIFEESSTPLLVYATEDGLNAPLHPLADSLQRFAKADSKVFRGELQLEQTERETAEQTEREPAEQTERKPAEQESAFRRASNVSSVLVSPSKRKHRSNSIDSMATDRASIGSETNLQAVDFGDAEASLRAGDYADSGASMGFQEEMDEPRYPPLYPGQSDQVKETIEVHVPQSGGSTNPATEMERSRAPEMQERGGNSSLFGSRRSPTGSESQKGPSNKQVADPMDMDDVLSGHLD